MGAAASRNATNQAVNSLVSVINNTDQTCIQRGSDTTNVTVTCKQGSTCTVGNVDISQYVSINGTCQSVSYDTTSAKSSINEQISQIAKATSDIGSQAKSKNTTDLVTNLAVEVTNNFYQTCLSEAAASTNLTFVAEGGSTLGIGAIEVNQINNVMQQCVQQAVANSKAVSDYTSSISQSATSTVEGLFGSLGFILIIVLVIIGFPLFMGGSSGSIITMIIIVAIVIGLYFALAYWRKWWPFSGSSSSSS